MSEYEGKTVISPGHGGVPGGLVDGHGSVPGGLVDGPRAYQDQFRGFKSHRVRARRDFFLHKNTCQRKAPKRESAAFDEIDDQWEC